MLIYLADLNHNYFPGQNAVPLNIGYIAAHAKKHLADDVDICLFKYCDNLLDAIDNKQPALVGLSNYTWNESLNNFVGTYIKRVSPKTKIIMGGPNIRCDNEGIRSFLIANDFVDIYITNEGEIPFTLLLEKILQKNPDSKTISAEIRGFEIPSCFSLVDDILIGENAPENVESLDYLPSPYQTGLLDNFLSPEYMPLFESNRGCPHTCSFCTWGISARGKIKKFSLERIYSDMEYVSKKGIIFPLYTIVDANFGMLQRDIEIARKIKEIHEKYRSFHRLSLYWDKNSKEYIIEIAKILKGLANASIYFQTFDPYVEKMINRKNISSTRLMELSKLLIPISDRFYTDILLGLPGETMESHLMSLSRAFESGFDIIGGGEVRLLRGSTLETPESRLKFGIKTKYRLVQEGFGIYRGQFLAEFEESVRSTKWITEGEMLSLRVLRAMFFIAISIGEFTPLMKYLKTSGINIINVFQKIIEKKDSNPTACESIDWLFEKAQNEWFNSEEEGLIFFSDENNQKQLLDNPTIKLNFDFLSYLILSQKHYNAFYDLMQNVLFSHFPSVNMLIVSELLKLCKTRNYVINCLKGETETFISVPLSDETIEQLVKISYLKVSEEINFPKTILLTIDKLLAKSIYDLLKDSNRQIQAISLLNQKFYGKSYLTPTNEPVC